MATVTSEIVWLVALFKTFGVHHTQAAYLYCDSKAVLYIAANPVYHERTKHVEVDCHFIREKIQKAVLLSSFQDEPDEYIRFILRGSIEMTTAHATTYN